MAYVNTGYKRSLTFTLTRKIGGVTQIGYPKEYDGRLAFPGYSALTDNEAKKLSDVAYAARVAAFIAYVESIESGFDATTDMSNTNSVYDATACPPPPTTTTTTTTAAPTTTTTAAPTTTTTAAPTTTTTAAPTTTTTAAPTTTTTAAPTTTTTAAPTTTTTAAPTTTTTAAPTTTTTTPA